MAKILVTGGTGYIGSHTVVELHEAGHEVLLVDDLSNSDIRILNQLEKIIGFKPAFEQIDLCQESAVNDFISRHPDIDGVIHFAAFKAVGESVAHPIKYYRNNFYSLINLLTSMNLSLKLVFSSSCTVYGQPDQLPVSETAAVKKAESPYGNTKQVAEEMLMEQCAVSPQLKVVLLRYFNPVGAHESALIGELPNGVPQNLIPFITQSAIGKRGPITVYGNNYSTPDGTAIRDYIHVVDLAKAHVSALNRLLNGEVNSLEVFNIGTGKGSSVLEIIQAFEESTGQTLNYTIGERRSGDVEQTYADVRLANELLGWKAERDLQDMMRSAWAWENYLHEYPFE